MTEPMTVDPNVSGAQSSEDELRVDLNSRSWSFVSIRHPRRVPLFIPRDETYYWTREWQESIRRSMADLEAGNYTDFDSDEPKAFLRRFLGDED